MTATLFIQYFKTNFSYQEKYIGIDIIFFIDTEFPQPDGKEPEMQIGFPTDVKHVAHIGWDGPGTATNTTTTTNNNNSGGAPSWVSQETEKKMFKICADNIS